jgi:hypothetical protein
MRDHATYEVNACDEIDVKKIFSEIHKLVKLTKQKVNSMGGENEKFLNGLIQKAAEGVNHVQEIASDMKFSHHLI